MVSEWGEFGHSPALLLLLLLLPRVGSIAAALSLLHLPGPAARVSGRVRLFVGLLPKPGQVELASPHHIVPPRFHRHRHRRLWSTHMSWTSAPFGATWLQLCLLLSLSSFPLPLPLAGGNRSPSHNDHLMTSWWTSSEELLPGLLTSPSRTTETIGVSDQMTF